MTPKMVIFLITIVLSGVKYGCMRLTGRHFLQDNICPTKNKPIFRRCVVCKKNDKRKETKYKCADCNDIPLCPSTCFENYHTKKYY